MGHKVPCLLTSLLVIPRRKSIMSQVYLSQRPQAGRKPGFFYEIIEIIVPGTQVIRAVKENITKEKRVFLMLYGIFS